MTIHRSAPFAVVAALTALLAQAPAAADPWAGLIAASGTYTPGLGVACSGRQQVSFVGSLTINASSHAGTYWFGFDGETIGCPTLLSEQAEGFVNGDIVGPLRYTRTGTFLEARGNVWLGSSQEALYAACHWMPSSILPTTSFNLECIATQQSSGN